VFGTRHSSSLKLARLVEIITRIFSEKKLKVAVFLDVAKAFDTIWIDGLLYKLTLLKFPPYIVYTITLYLRSRTSFRRGMRAGVAQGGLISPVLFSLYVSNMPSPSHHVKLALYADDTAITATSRKPTLLVSYLEPFLNELQRWLSERRITIVSKNTALIFMRAGRRFIEPLPVTIFGEPIEWVDRTRYLGVTLDTRVTRSPHIDQVRKRTAQRMGMLAPSSISDLSFSNGVLLHKQLIRPMMDYACPAWRAAARSHVRRLQVLQTQCLRLAISALWYVTGRYTRTWVFHCLPTTSEP